MFRRAVVPRNGLEASACFETSTSKRRRLTLVPPRHLNSGRYLSLNSSNLWQKGQRLIATALKLGCHPGGDASFGEGDHPHHPHAPANDAPHKETYHFASNDFGTAANCCLHFHPPYGALRSKGGMANKVEELTNGAPVQVCVQSRWMHAGDAEIEMMDDADADDTAVIARSSRPGSLNLIFERFVPPADNLDILVGTAAYARLRAFGDSLERGAGHW